MLQVQIKIAHLYTQKLQKLIYLHLHTGCFMKISLHSSEQNLVEIQPLSILAHLFIFKESHRNIELKQPIMNHFLHLRKSHNLVWFKHILFRRKGLGEAYNTTMPSLQFGLNNIYWYKISRIHVHCYQGLLTVVLPHTHDPAHIIDLRYLRYTVLILIIHTGKTTPVNSYT